MFNIVNLKYEGDIKSWLDNDNNAYVGRSNRFVCNAKWGNPYKLSKFNNRQQVIDLYTKYVLNKKHLAESVSVLKGKVLGCYCSPNLCHAEVLHKLAGNIPVYKKYFQEEQLGLSSKDLTEATTTTMTHDHNTRKSNSSDTKPLMSPKPTNVKPVKLNTA